jgi:hypothetical protein
MFSFRRSILQVSLSKLSEGCSKSGCQKGPALKWTFRGCLSLEVLQMVMKFCTEVCYFVPRYKFLHCYLPRFEKTFPDIPISAICCEVNTRDSRIGSWYASSVLLDWSHIVLQFCCIDPVVVYFPRMSSV